MKVVTTAQAQGDGADGLPMAWCGDETGSDNGGKTAAVLRSFIASCKRCGVEPFAWFHDVLSRIPAHSIARIGQLLPHNWKSTTCPVQA